jgi:hypothetical protein
MHQRAPQSGLYGLLIVYLGSPLYRCFPAKCKPSSPALGNGEERWMIQSCSPLLMLRFCRVQDALSSPAARIVHVYSPTLMYTAPIRQVICPGRRASCQGNDVACSAIPEFKDLTPASSRLTMQATTGHRGLEEVGTMQFGAVDTILRLP